MAAILLALSNENLGSYNIQTQIICVALKTPGGIDNCHPSRVIMAVRCALHPPLELMIESIEESRVESQYKTLILISPLSDSY